MYDPEAAQQLEATVAEEKIQVQRCKEHVDDLASHLAGACTTLIPSLIHSFLHAFIPSSVHARQAQTAQLNIQ